jgi:kumamolisin
MRKTFNYRLGLLAVAGAAAMALSAAPAMAQQNQVTLSQSVVPFDENVQLLGSAAPQAIVKFEVGLKLRDRAGLQRSIDSGKVMSYAELKARHLPTQADYDKVLNWLTSAGLNVDKTSPSRMTVWVSGPVATVSRAIGVHFSRIRSEGKDYVSTDSAPSLPKAVAAPVLGVFGLQPQIHAYKHKAIEAPMVHTDSATAPPFYAQAFLSGYNATGLGNGGVGATTAIVIDTFPHEDDLKSYWSQIGSTQKIKNISFITVGDGADGPLSGEESMDAEVSSAIAPKSKVRVYGSGSLNTSALDDVFNAIIDDMGEGGVKVTQVSISLGLCETKAPHNLLTRDDGFFQTISALGGSIFVSSGDAGSQECGKKFGNTVSFYASSPNVTAVGGTHLTLKGDGSTNTETAWQGSGGGVSSFFATPAYQSDLSPDFPKRALPDISADADPNTGALVVYNHGSHQIGGTSLSAPIMAGLTALVNSSRIKAHKAPIGLINNHIYGLDASNFRDITVGNNIGFTAGPGYDLVTGLGAPVMSNLLPALVAKP